MHPSSALGALAPRWHPAAARHSEPHRGGTSPRRSSGPAPVQRRHMHDNEFSRMNTPPNQKRAHSLQHSVGEDALVELCCCERDRLFRKRCQAKSFGKAFTRREVQEWEALAWPQPERFQDLGLLDWPSSEAECHILPGIGHLSNLW